MEKSIEHFAGYELLEKISESQRSRVFRARKNADGCPVILKFLLLSGYGSDERARLRNEYDIISRIDWPGIVRTLDIIDDGERLALVLEDFNGIPLSSLIKTGRFSMDVFLKTALSITGALGVLHRNGVIHRDIKPHNILVDPKTSEIKIADFGISTRFSKSDTDRGTAAFEGTIQYVSPEQTGRINQSVDHRTDFYSLGVTFYEMLTGTLPFPATDPLELIHCHIAKPAPRPSSAVENIPEIISDIVVKLMSKNADDRYAGAAGLEADLLRCQREFSENGNVSSFPVGADDRQTLLLMPQKIVGREAEENELLNAIRSIGSDGPKFILVSGEPGIGKSALISALFRPVAERGGFFTSGRFDSFRQSVPFSSIVQAVQSLLKQILVHGDEYIEQWRERLTAAAGSNGRVITDVIPMAEYIIGRQSPSPELDPEETKNRFNYTLKNFIKAFASPLRPLVIFFDDLQWIDRASAGFLQSLLSDRSVSNLLVIGTCRSIETGGGHPLTDMIEHLDGNGNGPRRINLEPISRGAIYEILSYVLHRSDPKTDEIAGIIHEKTNGNPFFINQFIRSLFEQEIIANDPVNGWMWDASAVRNMVMTSNVIEHMAQRISRLPELSRRALTAASCIGDRFDLLTLSVVLGRPVVELLNDMREFVNSGYLKMSNDMYYFQHDRIHEAAYSIIADKEKSDIHLRIGRMELSSLPEDRIRDKIFYITGQLNRGIGGITDRDELLKLSDLNRKAGDRARESSAYDSAMRYYEFSVNLLEGDIWKNDYDYAYSLYLDLAECAYLSGEFARAKSGFESVFAESVSDYDRALVCNKMAVLYTSMGKPLEAVRIGLRGLRLLGIKIPEKSGKLRVMSGLLKFMFLMRNRTIEDLYKLPVMSDKKYILVMHLFNNTGTPGYYVSPDLFAAMVFNAVNISLKYGNSEHTAFAYMALGSIISTAFGKHQKAFRLGLTALRLNEKYDNIRYRCKNNFSFAFFIQPWIKHVNENYSYFENGFRFGIESGDHIFSGHCVNNLYFHRLFAGDNIDDAFSVYNERVEFLKGLKDPFLYSNYIDNSRLHLALKGKTPIPYSMDGDGYSESDREHSLCSSDNLMDRFLFHLIRMKLLYYNRKFGEAYEVASVPRNLIQAPVGSLFLPEFYFYDALISAAAASSLAGSARKKALRDLNKGRMALKKLAACNESNFLHKYLILEAEMKRLTGHGEEACDLYVKAMRQAKRSGYSQDMGIICETAADYYFSIGHGETGDFYLSKAYGYYKKWGSNLKLAIIRGRNPRIADAFESKDLPAGSGTIYSSGAGNDSLDLSTVIKASQAISGEIHAVSLLETLMKIIFENAGAEKGALLFEKDDSLYVEAAGDSSGGVTIERIKLTADSSFLPAALINYVNRTGETVTLDDAVNDPLFQNDPYITGRKICSILCFSFSSSGGSSSILYLENSLVKGAFTADRVKLLSILMTQAAISIENARLVSVEKQNAALEREISMATDIQQGLLPRSLPADDRFSAAFRYIPMMGVGGDFISMRYLPDRNLLGLFLCDVSGHGVPAAFTATMVSMGLDFVWESLMDHPAEVLKSLRNLLMGKMAGSFFTAAICVIDLKKKVLVSCNAGHPPIIHIKKKGKAAFIHSKGRLINELFEPEFEETVTRLNSGDRLLIYTDGITEAEDSNNRMLGGEDADFIHWADSLSGTASDPENLCSDIIEALLTHTEGKSIDDDVALIAVEIK